MTGSIFLLYRFFGFEPGLGYKFAKSSIMQVDKLEALQNSIKSAASTYKKWLDVFKQNNPDQEKFYYHGTMTLWGDHVRFALKAFFVDHNISATKQQFYTCGKLDEYAIVRHYANTLDSRIDHLTCVLLSDSPTLIQSYACLKHSQYEQSIQRGLAAPLYIMYCILKDDWAEYERIMPVMKSKAVPKFKMELDEAYFQALAAKDKSRMEELLAAIVSPKEHNRRSKHYILINQFISYHGLCYAKLAWLKGIPVEVNSPLIPKELLPLEPLPAYKNEYHFLLT